MSFFHPDDTTTDTDQGSAPDQLAGNNVICTGLSGNELYCAAMVGYEPGNLLMGNSVYALGYLGGIASNIHMTIGGEIPQFTNMISEGRRLSLQRFDGELQAANAIGATGVTSELVFHPGNVEFLSIGSSLYAAQQTSQQGYMTTSADGQELFCQVDAGFNPLRFVFGNVAYSIGIGRSMLGNIRQLAHGEVKQYSDIFTTTRNLALERICADAKQYNANSVVGIRTTILSIGVPDVHEMVMIGTASHNEKLDQLAQQAGGVITSDLTAEETWNVTRLGYAPVQLVLGTSVYSLGVMGGLKAALRSIARGEVNTLTQLVYGAREQSLKRMQEQARAVNCEMVLGVKTYIYQLEGDLIEFLAIGTAVTRVEGVAPRSQQLPAQAIIRDKTTFVNTAVDSVGSNLNRTSTDTQYTDTQV